MVKTFNRREGGRKEGRREGGREGRREGREGRKEIEIRKSQHCVL